MREEGGILARIRKEEKEITRDPGKEPPVPDIRVRSTSTKHSTFVPVSSRVHPLRENGRSAVRASAGVTMSPMDLLLPWTVGLHLVCSCMAS